MPTGYTYEVAEGEVTDLEPFIWNCARGLGALIMMRDLPSDAPVPERFEPSPRYAEKLVELRAERDRLRSLSDDQAVEMARAEYDADCASRDNYLSEKVKQRHRYQAMIAKVSAWSGAPEGIKDFALEQLHRGMDFDCPANTTYWKEPTLLSGNEWRLNALEKVQKDIEYNATEDAKERERTEGRNSWVAHLRASLASRIEARSDATGTGAAEGESLIGAAETPNPLSHAEAKQPALSTGPADTPAVGPTELNGAE